MSLACIRAMQLAERIHAGVEEADRLRLEEHLGQCTRCTEEARLLDAIARAARSVGTLDAGARQRAFAHALRSRSEANERLAPSSPLAPRSVWMVAAAVCVAALVALVVRNVEPVGAPTATTNLEEPSKVVEPAPTSSAAAERSFDLAAGETATLERASATALRQSAVVWDPATATLRVSHGALRVEVEPGRVEPFRVLTEKYRVEVLGTIFVVDDVEVRVERGRVRVARLQGEPFPQEVTAGQRWTLESSTTSFAPGLEDARREPASVSSVPSVGQPAANPKNAAALLARARKQLAAGDASSARGLVEQALAGGLTPSQDAEAQTLLAECSLVSGDPKEAARRYAEVARKHGDLPAGETALFAAARTAHGAGQKAEARKLLNQYLARYPKGQFVNEARTRLSQLSP